jgi:hypothetical protein
MTLRLVLAVCLGLAAYAQTPAPAASAAAATAAPQVSADTMTQAIYISLLHRVERIEKMADQLEAANKDPKHAARKWLQTKTGLTDQEFAKVRPIVLEAISSTKAKQAEANDAFTQAQQANPRGGPLTTTQKHAIGALHAQEEQLVLDHVQQIAKVLGPGRFAQFDSAVRAVVGPNIKVIPLGPKQ